MTRRRSHRDKTRWAVAILAVGAVLVVYGLLRGSPGDQVAASVPSTPAAPVSPTPTAPPEPVLQLPGDIKPSGPGVYVIGITTGEILGTAGTLKTFRIAVESNVAEEMDEFTRMVDATLGDARSWIAGKQVRFQRVAEGAPYDFTIYLVTRDTAHKLCGAGGNVDIRQNGIPYTSCRQVRQVIINLDRWRLSVPEYFENGTTLETYRQYVINHEVGHELGRGHEACPGKGKVAPTMLRQTLDLEGCTANPWPYVDGKRYAGPPVP